MEINGRLRNAVGLAMKAGKCVSGDFAVEKAVRAGKARLLLLDAAVSQSTLERYERFSERFGAPLARLPALGDAIGKPSRMIAAITDDNMCKLILGALPPRDMNGGKS